MKQIIRCPNCESQGIKQNLAEVLVSGAISVQRIRKGVLNGKYKEHTIIGGENLFIVCGNCGEIVYKREKHE